MTQTAETATTPRWVDVAVLGGDVQKIDFEDGMTVGQALQNAGVERQDGAVVQVNGQPASDDDVLETGSVVQVTSRIKNG